MRNFLLALLSLVYLSLPAQPVVIKNVTVIDVKTGKALPAQTVVINGEIISQLGPSDKIKLPPDAEIIDATGKFLMPGMTDAHIHFFQSGGLYTRPDVIDLRKKVPFEKERAFALQNAADYMRRYLRSGITTIIDVGGPMMNFTIRDSVGKTILPPNILVTGPLFSMVDRPQLGDDKPIVKITSIQQADSLFQKMLPYKPDFIKIWYIASATIPAEKNFALVKYIAEQTHKNGLKLAVHATQLKTAQLAVDAGADILVHSVDDAVIPDSTIKKWKEKNITYIPTLIVGMNYSRVFSGRLPHHQQDLKWANPMAYGSLMDPEAMTDEEMPATLKTFRKTGIPASRFAGDSISNINLVKLMHAGINIASGTDAGNIGTLHASSFLQELEAMQKAGLSIPEILKASTINAAIGFGKEKQWGSIEKGKLADLLLLDKDPLQSLQHLNTLEKLFKSGKMIYVDTLIKETPEEVVQRQVNAYNARNIDAFLDTYSDNIAFYNFPSSVSLRGKAELRKGYEQFFATTPNLHCEIVNRIIIGNKVIDREKVRAGEQTFNAVAVYEVTNGKITGVTFIQ